MTPAIFSIIAVIGAAYFAGWLINIGFWSKRKSFSLPSRGLLWTPVFAGVFFIAVDIYAFTVFPNGTPVMGLAILGLLVHFFLFFGALVQARKLEKHRCPRCGGWMEIEVTRSEGGFEDAYTVTTSVKCNFCDFEKSTSKRSTEGTGHAVPVQYFIEVEASKKEDDGKKSERISSDEG